MERDEENGDNAGRCIEVNVASTDAMHKLVKRSRSPTENVEREREEEGEELELSLGLSMNGRFGVDPATKKMRRSSSVSNIVFNVGCAGNGSQHRASGVELGVHAPLVRTCSMPSDTNGWRRREEGRISMEKLKNVADGEGLHVDFNGTFRMKIAREGFQNRHLQQLPKGSIESRGLQSHLTEGAIGRNMKEREPTVLVANSDEALVKNALVDMPYVSTKGLGPNSNKIEGFLYRYKKGEEVKIVCVCHGMFLSPAEFVRHGGGEDVAQPLKHIVVNPFPLC